MIFSSDIELEGSDFEQFSDSQYRILATLTHSLRLRYSLAVVTGHQHIAPGRKTDPGPFFDWAQYQQAFAGNTPQASIKPPLRFAVAHYKSQLHSWIFGRKKITFKDCASAF